MGLFSKRDKNPAASVLNNNRTDELPGQLAWLADAPMFIDGPRVDAFYDAVFRPDYGEISRTLGDQVTSETTIGGEFNLGALLPGVFGKAGVSADHSKGHERSTQTEVQPISNPYRHLLALALHYSTAKSDRLVLARTPSEATDGTGQQLSADWLLPNSDFIRNPPRAMIMLEVTPGCKLIPAAVELSSGRTEPLFERLVKGFTEKGATPAPEYPGSHAPLEARNEYWKWFVQAYNDRVALDVVEDAAENQRIQWIAYRVSFAGDTGPFLHITLNARGAYDTGIFGYNFINRGTKHGLRIVGTLKSEPDIDVLAVFER